MAMIEIKNLNKWYGNFQVLKNCNVTVEKGEVVVVCGPSGSGKSTLIKTVNALEPFQEGEIIVDGVSVGDPKTDLPKLRSRVGMVFQHFELFPHLSIKENLILAQMKVLGRSREESLTRGLKLLFFTLLAACTVAALQTVGAFLVICLVVTPGATAWLLTDRFPRLLAIAVSIGSLTSFFGAWLSYYLDGATGGIIVVAQTLLFLITFIFAPKHGLLPSRRRAREAAC